MSLSFYVLIGVHSSTDFTATTAACTIVQPQEVLARNPLFPMSRLLTATVPQE